MRVPYERNQRYKIDRKLSTLVGGPGHTPGKNEKVYHAYYQWVPFFLFFQALLFYSPHAFWKAYDSGKIKNLVQDLSMEKHILERSGSSEKCSHSTQIARYLVKAKGQHVGWAAAYVFAEFGNLVVVLGNMYLTDYFLGREFSSFGPKVLQLIDEDPESRMDPMTKVFPRVTKCNLNTFGPSGSIQKFDALCVLSSNILNEKIFTFLWFWFVVVAVITILSFMYRIAFLLSFGMRQRALGSAQDFPEKSQGKYVVAHIGRSDWLVLRFLRLNMDSVTFYKLIKSIHEELMQTGSVEFPAVETYKLGRQK
ncbi:Innexin inx2 [Orchesella cincta]|uniref:Innexin n=1 Tax=Orchesella cincta TaxID=48709 RepID=A0A1D2MHB6_ORCCI|nr:Innexin inx2 [Orchesella cincta]